MVGTEGPAQASQMFTIQGHTCLTMGHLFSYSGKLPKRPGWRHPSHLLACTEGFMEHPQGLNGDQRKTLQAPVCPD